MRRKHGGFTIDNELDADHREAVVMKAARLELLAHNALGPNKLRLPVAPFELPLFEVICV